MEIGLGLDFSLGLSFDDQAALSRDAASLGYQSLWTPEGAGQDSFQLCALRWRASTEVVPEGLGTGISVSPVAYRSPVAFAMSAGTLTAMSGNKFILGIGSGGIYRPAVRRALGFRGRSTIESMREYVTSVRSLLAGETVTMHGQAVHLEDVQLGIAPPPRTPVFLGALGPRMLSLAGETADGAALNWCNPERLAWSRERVNEGAAKAGRNPSQVRLAEYIRICVDNDAAVARDAYVRSMMGYALGEEVPTETQRQYGYRAHFERMGYAEDLARLDRMRESGAEQDDLVAAFPDQLALEVGYFGKPEGAAAAFRELAPHLVPPGADESVEALARRVRNPAAVRRLTD